MTRQELVFKKAELQRQLGALKQKIEAIDSVLELLREKAPIRSRNGRYNNTSIAKAVVDFLSRTPGEFMHVAGIAAALKREGIKSKSRNFTTVVSSTCNRLATGKSKKLVRKKKRKADAKVSPYQAGETEKNEPTVAARRLNDAWRSEQHFRLPPTSLGLEGNSQNENIENIQ